MQVRLANLPSKNGNQPTDYCGIKRPPASSELVINWHVTEACNYSCHYCYAKWDSAAHQRELIHDDVGSARLLAELRAFFAPGNEGTPLSKAFKWKSVRLNLAGGEPLLYGRQILRIASLARELGFGVSIISNASLLNGAQIGELARHLSLLGVSVDSVSFTRNQAIGRQDRRGRQLSPDLLEYRIAAARQANPALRLKVNTVVNAHNWDEDMAPLIRQLQPEKWKVLRMLPVVTEDLAVTAAQYDSFVQRHSGKGLPLQIEDNDDMTEAYIMIDPLGRFFQNACLQKGYQYSSPILRVGASTAFSEITVSPTRYLARYPSVGTR